MNLPILELSKKLLEIRSKDQFVPGEIAQINITASFKTSIIIEIIDNSETTIKQITCVTTKDFICQTFWQIPKDIISGPYTIKAKDGINMDEKEVVIRN